ncbi:MAG: CvpA family protein [Parcubacteria group bacterium]|nr:CvpA family protein [Parcubacteria group bacterium]
MLIIDYILLGMVGWSTVWGFKKGLIRSVGGLVGLAGSVVIASRYYEPVAEWIAPLIGFDRNINLARMVAFVALLIAVNYAVSFIVSLAERAYTAVAVLPFMQFGNRLLGAALGLLQSSILLGLVLYFAARFPFGSAVQSFFDGSRVAPILLGVAGIVQPLLPDAIKQIQSLI